MAKKEKKNILDFYEGVLGSAALRINDKGTIFSIFTGAPLNVSGKDLVLPTRTILRNPDWDNTVAFHPMSESVIRGESKVSQALRLEMGLRLNFVALGLIIRLWEIASNPEEHGSLNARQGKFLSLAPKADAKSIAAVRKLADVIDPTSSEKLLNLYLKRNGVHDGEEVRRLGVVTTPIYQEKANGDSKNYSIYGVKFRKTDFYAFFDMLEYILPNAEGGTYNFPSDQMEVPYFHALLGSFHNVATHLNKLVKLFRVHMGEDWKEDFLIDMPWEGEINSLVDYMGMIPNLEGNEGVMMDDEGNEIVEEEEVETTIAPKPATSRWAAETPSADDTPTHAPTTTAPAGPSGTRSMAEIREAKNKAMQGQQPHNPWGQPPVQQQPQNTWPVQQQQQAPQGAYSMALTPESQQTPGWGQPPVQQKVRGRSYYNPQPQAQPQGMGWGMNNGGGQSAI